MATPDPIPNSAVKPFSADGTAWETVWESRTLPGLKFALTKARLKSPSELMGFFVLKSKKYLAVFVFWVYGYSNLIKKRSFYV